MERQFYRIIRSGRATLNDFLTSRDLGKPLMSEQYRREWSEAISVFDDFDHAVKRARLNRGVLGEYIVRITVPDDGTIEFRQTTRDRHHYSVYSTPDRLIKMADELGVFVGTED